MNLRNRNISLNENEDEEKEVELDNENEVIQFYDVYIDTIYKGTYFVLDYICKTIIFIIKLCGIYFIWIFLHHMASQLYVSLCVPNTIIGFIVSPFMVTTPQCQSLRWIIYNAGTIITNMWVVLGTWLCSYLLVNTNTNTNTGDT